LGQRKLRRHEHHRSFGPLPYCERCPQPLWVSKRLSGNLFALPQRDQAASLR
jgi:hypothetical protein